MFNWIIKWRSKKGEFKNININLRKLKLKLSNDKSDKIFRSIFWKDLVTRIRIYLSFKIIIKQPQSYNC